MKRINQTFCVAVIALTFVACNKNKDADSPDNMSDGSAERTGEDLDEATREAEEDIEEAADDVGEEMEEAGNEVDGDPTTN